MRIFVFGTENVGDDTAFRVAEALEKDTANKMSIEFIYEADPLSLISEKEIIILDAAQGIKSPVLIEDICALEKKEHLVTMHDIDLHYIMQLFSALELGIKIRIIALPMAENQKQIKEIAKSTQELIESI